MNFAEYKNKLQSAVAEQSETDVLSRLPSCIPSAGSTLAFDSQDLLELYQSFLATSHHESQYVSSLFLKVVCETVLRSICAWQKFNGAWIPDADLFETVKTLCDEETQRLDNLYAAYYRGVFWHVVDDDKWALSEFRNAAIVLRQHRKIMIDDEHGCLHLKSIDLRTLSRQHKAAPFVFDPQWHVRNGTDKNRDCVAVFFDDVYFQAFSEHLLASFLDVVKSPDYVLHFHVTNLSDVGRELAAKLSTAATEAGLTLNISYDNANVRDRAYFTCTRFLALELLLLEYRSVVISDADSEFLVCPSEVFADYRGVDLGFLISNGPWGYKPWRRVWAGLCRFERGEAAKLFAAVFRQVLMVLWDTERNENWWIDQNALYIALRMIKRLAHRISIRDLEKDASKFVHSSEEFKLRLLARQSDIGRLMGDGLSWGEALRKMQL